MIFQTAMPDHTEQQLANLPSAKLAEALCQLAVRDERAQRMVDRLLLPRDQMEASIRSRLDYMAKSDQVYSWRESHLLGNELSEIVEDIQQEVKNPSTALDLLDRFFSMDGSIAERHHDSDGELNMAFCIQATEAYLEAAKKSSESDAQLTARILKLAEQDSYGLRSDLCEAFPQVLSAKGCRDLAEHTLQIPQKDAAFIFSKMAETCAKKLKDADLFTRVRTHSRQGLQKRDHIKLAEIHFANKQYEQAQSELDHCKDDPLDERETQDLQIKIWEKQGRQKEILSLLRKKFLQYPTAQLLKKLNDSGLGKPDLLDSLADGLKEAERFDSHTVAFLLKHGYRAEAETAVFKHAEKIWGGDYHNLKALAEAFIKMRSPLAASILLRALLTDIMDESRSKAYQHAARYYQTLNRIAPSIDQWDPVVSHKDFLTDFDVHHKRKYAFWAKATPPS